MMFPDAIADAIQAIYYEADGTLEIVSGDAVLVQTEHLSEARARFLMGKILGTMAKHVLLQVVD